MEHLLAPIILFVYNRPWHTQQTVTSLLQCELAAKSHLYIFADGARNEADESGVTEVRQYIHAIRGFKQVVIYEREANLGLASSVIAGVNQILQLHGKGIVLEDDLLFAQNYLKFMNDALNRYQHHENIFSISGYNYPLPTPKNFPDDVYLLPRASSWGWATWLDRWEKADWQVSDYGAFRQDKTRQRSFAEGGEDLVYMLIKQQKGLINSWAVRWSYTHHKHRAYCLFPVVSKVQNIGNDSSGTHSPSTTRFDAEVSNAAYRLPHQPQVVPAAVASLQSFFRPSLIRRVINYFVLR